MQVKPITALTIGPLPGGPCRAGGGDDLRLGAPAFVDSTLSQGANPTTSLWLSRRLPGNCRDHLSKPATQHLPAGVVEIVAVVVVTQ